MPHRAQLRLCHQKIAAERTVHPKRRERADQFCSLTEGLVWCADCEYLICDIHAASRHDRHRLEAE